MGPSLNVTMNTIIEEFPSIVLRSERHMLSEGNTLNSISFSVSLFVETFVLCIVCYVCVWLFGYLRLWNEINILRVNSCDNDTGTF